jgi:phage host-nuclease inhibitor protein Gam
VSTASVATAAALEELEQELQLPDFDEEAEQEQPPVEVPEKFAVTDLQTAEWVVRKIVEARAHAKRVAEYAKREIAEAERTEKFMLARFTGELGALVRKELGAKLLEGKKKSLRCPSGLVGFKKQPFLISVRDEAACIAWAKSVNHPELVVTKEHFSKEKFNELYETEGIVPDEGAVSIRDEQDVLYVK